MSANLVHPQHVIKLAAFVAAHGNIPKYAIREHGGADVSRLQPYEAASYYAKVLWDENVRSVQHRYPGDDDMASDEDGAMVFDVPPDELTSLFLLDPVSILKMCDGLEYQSCENSNYYETTAYALLNMVRKAAVRALPGYADAPWCYEPD